MDILKQNKHQWLSAKQIHKLLSTKDISPTISSVESNLRRLRATPFVKTKQTTNKWHYSFLYQLEKD